MENLIGQTFNRLTVIKFDHSKNFMNYWLCRCSCGNEIIVYQGHLKGGHTKSCGCLKKEKLQDLTGKVFGLWTVISFNRSIKEGGRYRIYWNCKCACGVEGVVRSDILKAGESKSCGCYLRNRSLIDPPAYTEKEKVKRANSIYRHIKQRCYNVNEPAFKNYGARGIILCSRWLESFENFYKDMGPAPSNKHSIDRIDNDGPYSPENCRWATNTENMSHTRASVMIEYNGEIKCVTALAREYGINVSTLRNRISKWGDIEKSLFTPVKGRTKKI